MEDGVPTRYSTSQTERGRRNRYVLLGLIGAACLVIVVFALLLVLDGGV